MLRVSKTLVILAASASVLGLGCGASSAAAADADSAAAAAAVPDVVVTAQKRDENQQVVPVSTATFNERRLQVLGVDSFLDYAKFVPSLSFASLGPGQTDIILRGMPVIEGAPTVGIYVDGISIASGFTNPDPRLFDVKDVQVLRGPQGTLYGEGAIGGLILIRNDVPNPHAFAAKLDATFSQTDGSNTANDELNGMVNIPIVPDKLALRLVGFQRSYAGFINQVSTGLGIVDLAGDPAVPGGQGVLLKKDANTERVEGGRASLGFTPTDTFSLTLTGAYQDLKVGGDNFIMPTSQAMFFPTASPNSVFEDFRTTRDDQYIQLSGELVNDFGWATLTGDAGYVDRTLDIDQGYTLVTFNTVPGISNSDPKEFQTEWRLASPAGQALQWIAGARYTNSTNHILQTTDIPGYDFARKVGESSSTWAVFGEAAYTFSSLPITARVGLRYFNESQSLSSVITDSLSLIANPSPPQSRSADDSDVSPRFVLEYRFDPSHMVYGSISKGFRAGGVNVDLCNVTCPTVGFRPSYQPDFVWTYELGAKTEWLEHRLRVNAALFYNDWSNLQIDGDPQNPNTGFTTNAGKAHSAGFEGELTATPAQGLSFNLGGSVLQSQLDQPAMGAPAGSRLPNTPEWTFSAAGDYERPIYNDLRGFIHADVSTRGNAFGNIPNIPQSTTNAPFQFILRNEAPGFTTVDLRMGVEKDSWSVTLFADNVTNSRASSFDFNDDAVFGAFGVFLEQDYIARPRTIGVEFRARY
jgi:iron complex outermembrane receptor protein